MRLATLSGDADLEARLVVAMADLPDVELVMRCVDRIEAVAVIQSADIDALACVRLPAWVDQSLISEALARGIHLVGITDDPGERLLVENSGGVVLPISASIKAVLAACVEEISEPPPAEPKHSLSFDGRVIAVWGPKGAPGRTSLAIELAAVLAKREPSTMLIDADLYGGDIAQLLGIAEEVPTLVWAAATARKGELQSENLVEALRRPYRGAPAVLGGVRRPDLWAEISEEGWRNLLATARQTCRFVVCDIGFCLEPPSPLYVEETLGRNLVARVAAAEADHTVAVCSGDALGITSFLWSIDQLRDLTCSDPLVVVNKAKPQTAREVSDILKVQAGLKVLTFVPLRPRDFDRAKTIGRPVSTLKRTEEIREPVARMAVAVGQPASPHGFLTKLAGSR